MSLPVFDPQTHLFGLQARSSDVFGETDRYRRLRKRFIRGWWRRGRNSRRVIV